MKHRIESLKHLLETEKLDGYLVTKEVNLVYFTNYLSEEAKLLIPCDSESTLYVDGRFYEEAKVKVKDCKVELAKKKTILDEMVQSQIRDLKLEHLGFDFLDVPTYLNFAKALSNAEFTPKNELVMQLRKIKDKQEIECIRKAAEVTSEGMKAAIGAVRPGLKEYDVAAEAEYKMRKSGAGMAFDTIVAGGFRSAFPHARCSDYEIRKGDLVVIDLGASFQHYRADMTRTVVAGKPSSKQEKIYEIVKEAQEKAFQSVNAGVKCIDVDAVARKHIEKEGYAEYFIHGLGHGVGLEVHEAPTLNSESKDVLESGNVVTVEPGIYIAGFGGVRIEDTVLVAENKGEKLTKASYTLAVE